MLMVEKGRIVTYEHHGQKVFVWEGLKGEHRDMCLCYSCGEFGIDVNGPPVVESKCPIANANYENCVKYNTVQPVMECPKFSLYASLEGKVEVVDSLK